VTMLAEMKEIGRKAKAAARGLATSKTETRNAALAAMAKHLRAKANVILDANAKDVEAAKAKDMKSSFVDRLVLNAGRLESIASGIEDIARLDDPVGKVISKWTRPNGMEISRVAVPIGVIGIIFESRPNVTADAGGLCIKSGNAAILRGGSDSFHSSEAIVSCLRQGLADVGLDPNAIQMVPTADRSAVGDMLTGLDGAIDVIVPRGGKSLVARVQQDARVPVFSHLEGICHVFVDRDADLAMAETIVLNAKMRRTGVCGSAETILIDERIASSALPRLIKMLLDAGCEVRGDETTQHVDPRVKPATEEDWRTEYLDAIVSMKVVDGVYEAMDHIAHYGSHHTDSIITTNTETAERFLNSVDSAIVLHNASTQFADGGEFGFGAEIGIATGKMHARGPVGVEQLTTFKYQIRGSGQIRPV
jgi:glutamate-5-semialdehyde dehydrogenase